MRTRSTFLLRVVAHRAGNLHDAVKYCLRGRPFGLSSHHETHWPLARHRNLRSLFAAFTETVAAFLAFFLILLAGIASNIPERSMDDCTTIRVDQFRQDKSFIIEPKVGQHSAATEPMSEQTHAQNGSLGVAAKVILCAAQTEPVLCVSCLKTW